MLNVRHIALQPFAIHDRRVDGVKAPGESVCHCGSAGEIEGDEVAFGPTLPAIWKARSCTPGDKQQERDFSFIKI